MIYHKPVIKLIFWFLKPKVSFILFLNITLILGVYTRSLFLKKESIKSGPGTITNLKIDFTNSNHRKSYYATFEVQSLSMKFYMNLNESLNEQVKIKKIIGKNAVTFYVSPHKPGFSHAAQITSGKISIGDKNSYLEWRIKRKWHILWYTIISFCLSTILCVRYLRSK